MTRLTILIPALDWNEALEYTLASVLRHRPADDDVEVLVAHRGRHADPYDLKDEVRFCEAPASANLIELMNQGLAASSGEYLHVLQCGLEVEEGWSDRVEECFADSSVGAVAPLVMCPNCPGKVLAAGVGYRVGGTRELWTPPGGAADEPWTLAQPTLGRGALGRDALAAHSPARGSPTRWVGPTFLAAFYRQSALRAIGGWEPSVGLALADVDVALSLGEAGYSALLDLESRVYLTGEWPLETLTYFEQGQRAERLFWRHAAAHGWSALARHPFCWAGEFARGLGGGALGRLSGRLSVCCRLALGGRVKRAASPSKDAVEPSTPTSRDGWTFSVARGQRHPAHAAGVK